MRQFQKKFSDEERNLFERLAPYLSDLEMSSIFNSNPNAIRKMRCVYKLKKIKNKVPIVVLLPAASFEEYRTLTLQQGFFRVEDEE